MFIKRGMPRPYLQCCDVGAYGYTPELSLGRNALRPYDNAAKGIFMYPIPKLDDFMRILAELRELQNAYVYRVLGGNELYPDRTLVPEIKTAEYIRIVKMYMEIYLMCRKQFGEEMGELTTENTEGRRENDAPHARHCDEHRNRCEEANPLPPGQYSCAEKEENIFTTETRRHGEEFPETRSGQQAATPLSLHEKDTTTENTEERGENNKAKELEIEKVRDAEQRNHIFSKAFMIKSPLYRNLLYPAALCALDSS